MAEPFLALITPLNAGASSPGHPAHPIAPGGPPPGIWGGSNEGFPTHPIAPGGPPPTSPPTDPPSVDWEWGWNPQAGWLPVYVPGDKPQPPRTPPATPKS